MTRTVKVRGSLWILAAAGALAVVSSGGCSSSGPATNPDPSPAAALTFNKDVAPIIFEKCALCHRPGESAPFNLLGYQDVKKRAPQIVAVTQSRFMPPWLPEPGQAEFSGDLSLSTDQIAKIKRWVDSGAPEGHPSDLPAAPVFSDGWQLGPPDLVVRLPEAYVLSADGGDVFRNFVLPIPITAVRYVKAVELRPGNKKVVHHANMLIDRTGSARLRDAQDPQVGFDGMDASAEGERPEGHFLTWKPGTPILREPDDTAWRLEEGADLIVNMHMVPSGKPEVIQPVVGFYFTARPAAAPTMFQIQLEHDGAIDIPAGQRDYVVHDEFELPVDVQVLGVYPHAHLLCRDMRAWARLPDSNEKQLLHIKSWDLNWQGVYRYSVPIPLPKGAVVSMSYTYDNSGENLRNPNHPPERVRAGNRTSDEMGHLWLQVRTRSSEDLTMLQEWHYRHRLRKYPNDWSAHYNLGTILGQQGRLVESLDQLRQAVRVRPGSAKTQYNLATALASMGRLDEAAAAYAEVVRLNPDHADAHYNLGSLLALRGRTDDAIRHFEQALRIRPDHADAHHNLGNSLASLGRLDEAIGHFRQALSARPDDYLAHNSLGMALAARGSFDEAIDHFRQALRIRPGDPDVQRNLDKAMKK